MEVTYVGSFRDLNYVSFIEWFYLYISKYVYETTRLLDVS